MTGAPAIPTSRATGARAVRCCSSAIEAGDTPTRVLVDTGPDMRAQLLAADVGFIDAVIFTHAHADHTHGIDDLRAFWLNTHRLVDTYADEKTQAHLERAFGYCFATTARQRLSADPQAPSRWRRTRR